MSIKCILAAILLSLFSGCAFLESFSALTSGGEAKWLSQWLEQPLCMPPCWNGIVPGETTIEDAAKKLSTGSDIELKLLTPDGDYKGERELHWVFIGSDDNGLIITDEEGVITSKIILNIYSELTIQDIIKIYGDPSNVHVFDCRVETIGNSCSVNLIFEEQGMILGIYVNKGIREELKVSLYPSTKIDNVTFYSAESDSYVELFNVDSEKGFVEWHDYGVYP